MYYTIGSVLATGLTIRDFFKEYREVRYSDSGSLRLTEVEHNAYVNRLTMEITHYDAPRAINNKTLPENTHWGYLTAFKGSSVVSNTAVKFVKQRMFECINQGIWEYHQNTENIGLSKAFAEQNATAVLSGGILEGGQEKIVDFYLKLISNLPEQIDQDLQWILSFFYRPDEPTELGNQEYTAFPIASPFPDVFKFKTDIPCSFLFRLESWYLVNPAVYIVANPTDSSDATEGEDEYPTPEPGDGDGDGGEFPPSDLPDGESDPRDYDPSNFGEQGVWNVSIRYSDGGNNPPCNNVPNTTFQIRGYKNQFPKYVRRGAENQFGAQSAFLVTSVEEVQVGETCATEVAGIPAFFADD